MNPKLRRLPPWALACGLAATSFAAGIDGDEIVVEMKKVPVFEIEEDVSFDRGGGGTCDVERSAEVKAYPSFKSDLPLFGSAQIPVANDTAAQHYAIDESNGTGTGYDRMYLDRNGNQDLTDDAPLAVWVDPPKNAIPYRREGDTVVCFEVFETVCDFGDEGKQPVEIMPRLKLDVYEGVLYRSVAFVGTSAYRGEVKLGERDYVVYLGHDRTAAGRYNEPNTALFLFPKNERRNRPYWWGGDRLSAFHELEGVLYGFSASPSGNRLTAKPYDGKFGTFAIGAGERELEELLVQGSLRAESAAVAVGQTTKEYWPQPTSSCQLPVGDYLPSYLTVDFGHLRISLSNNYHADGKPREAGSRVYGIEIREDRPFVLDFSNEPDVVFASPAKNARLAVGETLELKAVLVDPVLDIMIRGLDDKNQTKEETFDFEDGKSSRFSQPVSLDPQVIITRANGEKVTQGDLPFG